jgi:hypothetical protein
LRKAVVSNLYIFSFRFLKKIETKSKNIVETL